MQEDKLIGRYLKTLRDKPQCIRSKKGDILKITEESSCLNISSNDSTRWAFSFETGYYELLPIDFSPYYESKVELWEPKVGEYAIMEQAGGWGYSPDNNGCIAIIEKVNTRTVDGSFHTYSIDGRILNSKNKDGRNTFKNVPIRRRTRDIVSVVCRKALPHEIPSNNEFKVGDWIVYTGSDTPGLKKGTVTQITFYGNHNGVLKLMTTELDKEYPGKTGWQYARNFRLALPNESLSAATGILQSFPQEGCVYYDRDIDDLYSLSKYLTSRAYNKADGKTERWEAVGIGWNMNSYWWLKTRASNKTEYNLKDIQHLYPNVQPPTDKPLNTHIILDDSHLGSIVSCSYANRFYNECLFIKEHNHYYLLNNCYSNYDAHKDKSKYKYSLIFTALQSLNTYLKNVKLLNTTSCNPFEEVSLASNGIVNLHIPEIKKLPVLVDYSVSLKLVDIKLPDYSVIPKKIQPIEIETYNIYL